MDLRGADEADFAAVVRGVCGLLAVHRLEVIGGMSMHAAQDHLAAVFPELAEPIDEICAARMDQLGGSNIRRLMKQEADHPIGTSSSLAWLYQYLKTPREEAAMASAHQPRGQKLSGRRLLDATQFFTEPYMVEYLVESTLGELDPSKLLVVDPACGGGNFLVAALRRLLRGSADTHLRDRLLEEHLRGYELDSLLGEVAALSIWIAAAELSWPTPNVRPRVEVGAREDLLGYLAPTQTSAELENRELRSARAVILTNPPFLGRRLMGDSLRAELRARFPLAGNDLAAAFLMRCVDQMRPGDGLGFVAPTNWMHLDTLAGLREAVLSRTVVEDCIDLGPGAFQDLNGDKVRVCLLTLRGGPVRRGETSRFVRLGDLPRLAKIRALECPPSDRVHKLAPELIRSSAREGIRYHLPAELTVALKRFRYGDVARPTQGSSTGDNARCVRPLWLGPADDPSWRLASKGGGYSRWAGLSAWRVHWGERGEILRARPGAALRNPDLVDEMALVFSDTGTRGLSVRRRLEGQIPMASGPGIVVCSGEVDAHLAVLNSRVMSAVIRTLTPKLTIAAGYVAKLPVPHEAAHDRVLAQLGSACFELKTQALVRRVGNAEHRYLAPGGRLPIDAAVDDAIATEVLREVERLDLEWKIEQRLAAILELSPACLDFVAVEGDPCAAATRTVTLDADPSRVDTLLAKSLDAGLRFRSMQGAAGRACDGPVEALSFVIGASPASIADFVVRNVRGLERLRERYADDLMHQAVLAAVGFRSDGAWSPTRRSISEVAEAVSEWYLFDGDPRGWISDRLVDVHTEALRAAPVLQVEGPDVVLSRSA